MKPSLSLSLLFSLAMPLHAQLPGTPVLQNGFANKGIALAVNYGKETGSDTWAGAVAWAPGSMRYVISAGAGSIKPDSGKAVSAWGGRLAAPLPWFKGAIGIAPFVGVGGASPSGAKLLTVPAGVGLGLRRSLGATSGISLYATPFFSWTRVTAGGVTASHGLVRASFGVDASFIRKVGVTFGYETGATAKAGQPGPTTGVFGAGLSYVFQ